MGLLDLLAALRSKHSAAEHISISASYTTGAGIYPSAFCLSDLRGISLCYVCYSNTTFLLNDS